MTAERDFRLPEPMEPQLRRDPVTNTWTIIAPERARRPIHTLGDNAPQACPFCESHETLTPPEIDALRIDGSSDGPGWSVRVIPNKYPAVLSGAPPAGSLVDLPSTLPGVGRHEVVVEAPEHLLSITSKDEVHWSAVFSMYQRRLRALRADPNVRYGMLFKNVGASAGASQEHAHSQILGIPILPTMVVAELDSCRRHYEATGTGLFQQLVESELVTGERLAGESEHFVAICPFASRFPCELWILPKTGEPSFPDHPQEQIRELGAFAKSLLVALETMLPEPAYNYFLHTAPFDGQTHLYYHWHLEVTPRIVGLAGFELGSGMFINPIPPEWAAQQIRQRLSQA